MSWRYDCCCHHCAEPEQEPPQREGRRRPGPEWGREGWIPRGRITGLEGGYPIYNSVFLTAPSMALSRPSVFK